MFWKYPSDIETLTHSVTILGHRVFKVAIKLNEANRGL